MIPVSPGTAPPRATFRDPAGSLRISGEQVLRTVQPSYAHECLRFLESDLAQRWMADGHLIESHVLSEGVISGAGSSPYAVSQYDLASSENQPLLLQHPRVFFPSYPWEWSPGQWVAAAELTLELCRQLLPYGWILKDATPLNILFEGPRPIFVDVLSIERRDPNSPLWLAYGQFARTFLLPLAAHTSLGWPLAVALDRRDGFEPIDLYPYLSAWQKWRSPLRSLVTLPYLLEKKKGTGTAPGLRQQPVIATEVLGRNLRGFGNTLRSLAPRERTSKWSNYPAAADHYTPEEQRHKQEFVARALQTLRPGTVLDIGGNTGQYSRIAASVGARVVAWDTDLASSDLNWAEARNAGLPILPLIANLARPTPAAGWCNTESLSLLERARDRFDCVLMLGVLHHLLLADQIPLGEVAALLASLTRRSSIVEWVPRTDPRHVDLCRGRDQLYQHLDEPLFLRHFGRHFTITTREELSNGRVLFLLEKK